MEEKKYLDYQGLQTYHENLQSVLENSEQATAEALDNLDDRLKIIENKSPYSKSEIDNLLEPITDKLDDIEEFAEVNVQSDWNETNSNSDAYIKNKPDVKAIEDKIPSTASSTNQLADKEFVNSSISTSTATFRGTSAAGLTEAQFLEWANGLTKDANDYVFWNTADAAGTPQFKRYKYNGSAWVYEYTLNNSSFTADQWATINSLLTSAHKTKLDALPTNAELSTLLTGKVDKVTGKGLSTNDYTTDEKNKLGGIEAGAQKHIAPTAAEVKSALGTGSGTTKYLREDGTWQTPEGGDYEEQIEDLQQSVKEIQTNMSYAIDSIVSNFTLEGSSSPTFTVNNQGAAAQYINRMGGYLFLVKNGNVYAAKLNPSNWGKFADGTVVTSAIKEATECMIHVPDCHYLGNGATLQFGGMTPINGGHVFASPHWVGAYQMSTGGHSRAGVGSVHSKTMTAFWQDAQAIHADFGLANYQFHCLINALYQARYGNLNSESFLSNGNARSSASWDAYRDLAHGMADSLGDGTGCVTATDRANVTRYVTKLFGFEDMFGKLWEFRPGIRFYMSGSVRHAVVYEGNVVSNTAEGRDISGVLSSASGQYATQMELGEYWDMLPKAVGGSETTYYCDGYWAATGGQLLLVGGYAYIGSLCGLSSANSNIAFSITYDIIGARLAFYSEPEIVSGAELLSMLAQAGIGQEPVGAKRKAKSECVAF